VDNVTRTYAYNKADQVTGWTEGNKVGAYVYDPDGNTVQKTVTDNGVLADQWDYKFDSVGRMAEGQQSIHGTQSIVNIYAGDQWYRMQETVSGTTRKFGWRRDELFAEFDNSDNLTTGYLNDGVDMPLYKTNFSNNGQAVDSRHFYHQDQNLRVHHLTDAGGNILEKYVYNGYGKRTILDAQNTEIQTSAHGNRIGFQGREHEDLTGPAQEHGLTFHRNRFYDPDVGRWGRRDPIGYEGGINLYCYVDAQVVTGIDSYGEFDVKKFISDKMIKAGGSKTFTGRIPPIPLGPTTLNVNFTLAFELSWCCRGNDYITYAAGSFTVEGYVMIGKSFKSRPSRSELPAVKKHHRRPDKDLVVDGVSGELVQRRKARVAAPPPISGYRERIGYATFGDIPECPSERGSWSGNLFIRGSIGFFVGIQFNVTKPITDDFFRRWGVKADGGVAYGVKGASLEAGISGSYQFSIYLSIEKDSSKCQKCVSTNNEAY
jgi:RHS repeat-associated protein